MHSYKNTSPGGSGKKMEKIGEVHAPKPPAGKSNSYEKVYDKLSSMDDRAISNKHFSKEKMNNK